MTTARSNSNVVGHFSKSRLVRKSLLLVSIDKLQYKKYKKIHID